MSSLLLGRDGFPYRSFENTVVQLSVLAVIDDVIEDSTFLNCMITGPAMLILGDDTELSHSIFETGGGDIFSIALDLGNRQAISGAIGLRRCAFRRCRFSRIGFLLTTEQRQKFLAGTTSVAP